MKGKLSPDGLKHYLGPLKLDQQEAACRPSTHVDRLFTYARIGISFQVGGLDFQVALE